MQNDRNTKNGKKDIKIKGGITVQNPDPTNPINTVINELDQIDQSLWRLEIAKNLLIEAMSELTQLQEGQAQEKMPKKAES